MATWVAFENKHGNLTLLYRNLSNGAVQTCGELRRDTSERMILEWVIGTGQPCPGDLIKMESGRVYAVAFRSAHA